MRKGIVFDIKRYAIHDGPGIRTTVFLKGCPLSCRWCHNPEGISPKPEILVRAERCRHDRNCIEACPENAVSEIDELIHVDTAACTLCGDCIEACYPGALEIAGREVTVDEVVREVEKDRVFYEDSGGGVTFSGGEPLFQPDFLHDTLVECRNRGLHTAVDTSGMCTWDVLSRILRLTKLFLYDVKTVNDQKHRDFCGVSNVTILENLRTLCDTGADVRVRVPVVPGMNDTDEEARAIAEFLAACKGVRQVDLLPYHAWGLDKNRRLNAERENMREFPGGNGRIERMKEIFKKSGFSVKIGG